MTIRRLAAGLVAVPALLLGALAGTASAGLAPASTASATTSPAGPTAGPAWVPAGIGDPRDVTQPALPSAICATLQAQLPGRTRVFSDADEASPPDTARLQAALDA